MVLKFTHCHTVKELQFCFRYEPLCQKELVKILAVMERNSREIKF